MERDPKISYYFNLRETPMHIGGGQEKPDETLVGTMMRLIRNTRGRVVKPKKPPVPKPLHSEESLSG